MARSRSKVDKRPVEEIKETELELGWEDEVTEEIATGTGNAPRRGVEGSPDAEASASENPDSNDLPTLAPQGSPSTLPAPAKPRDE